VLPAVSESLCDIQDRQKSEGTSLGVFRPAEILDFTGTKAATPDWTKDELTLLTQQDLFMTREQKVLEKMPFVFRYKFRCAGCRAKKPHHMKIVDWELAQQFRRLQRASGTIDEALQKLRDNWLGNLCGADKDTHLFVGNMQAFPGTFLVLGVFWPPKQPQLGLFST
jgi:hypothetical protein